MQNVVETQETRRGVTLVDVGGLARLPAFTQVSSAVKWKDSEPPGSAMHQLDDTQETSRRGFAVAGNRLHPEPFQRMLGAPTATHSPGQEISIGVVASGRVRGGLESPFGGTGPRYEYTGYTRGARHCEQHGSPAAAKPRGQTRMLSPGRCFQHFNLLDWLDSCVNVRASKTSARTPQAGRRLAHQGA